MNTPVFPTSLSAIELRISKINPIAYAKSRNYVDGSVTNLSPYISRGVITLERIARSVLAGFSYAQAEKLIQELAWREYWLRVWEAKGDAIHSDLKQEQANVHHHQMLTALRDAQTGIQGIDQGIEQLYETGYMHNHVRMYTASLACNIAKAHWQQPAKWLYYHLLDHDPASNHLSWQWVAGSFSSKKYYCNQENISRYTNQHQTGTYLDTSYDALPDMSVPHELNQTFEQQLHTPLTPTPLPTLMNGEPVWLYNSFNLDPNFAPTDAANKVLVLDPDHYRSYPVSEKVIGFIVDMAKNLHPNIQVFVGPPHELAGAFPQTEFHYRKHPTTSQYPGIAHTPPYLFPEVSGYHGSFFGYWKKCERYIDRLKP